MSEIPTAAQIAEYLGIEETAPELAGAIAAEIGDQSARCRVDPYTDSLGEALKRRVAHNLAMKNIPLGVQMDEFGATRIGSADPEVRRLEAPYRKHIVG